jgi:arylsulfatase A-like enzyme
LNELDRLGLRQNTIVVFVADHGYQLGEKGKWSKAGSLFENGCRVPLIIHMPAAHGNGRPSTRIVQSLDIYRTLTELAGLEVPDPSIEGHSLVPLLQNPQAAWDHPAYSIWSEDGKTVHGTAIRTEQFRYAEFGPNAQNGAMLFAPHADPMELTNLADNPQHAATVAQLSKLVNAYSYPS